MTVVRPETQADLVAIRAVNRLAFGQSGEAGLVDRLRDEGLAIASLVAEAESAVVGHILFTRLPIYAATGTIIAAALAPMAVHPDHQRRGIGSRLVAEGVAACRARGVPAIVVLGHPDYYPRFGFSAEAARDLDAPFSGPAFMALALDPAISLAGPVEYPRAFFEIT